MTRIEYVVSAMAQPMLCDHLKEPQVVSYLEVIGISEPKVRVTTHCPLTKRFLCFRPLTRDGPGKSRTP